MHDAAFRRSFLTDKKDRWEKFSLSRSLQIDKQQNQIYFINQFTKNYSKKNDDSHDSLKDLTSSYYGII